MILAAMIIARNPAQYGFELTLPEPAPRETVTIDGPVDLRRIAEWTGTPVDVIQQLNPELRRWTTPVRGSGYELKVPEGTAEPLRAKLEESLDVDERVAELAHREVGRDDDDHRAQAAREPHRSGRGELSVGATRVRPGQKLIVPRPPTTLMAAQPDRPTPALETRPLVATRVAASSDDRRDEMRSAASSVTRRHAIASSAATRCSSIARAVLDHRVGAEAVEPAALESHQPRPAPHGLHVSELTTDAARRT